MRISSRCHIQQGINSYPEGRHKTPRSIVLTIRKNF